MTKHDHTSDAASGPNLHDQAERLSRRVSESAHQVWLAGLGALGRAQAEGGKLFETLVKEGESWEARSRQDSERGDSLRDTVETTLGQARERAAGTWDRVEKSFDDRVQRVLRRLQIPTRDDIEVLNERLDALNSRLNRSEANAARHDAEHSSGTATPPHTE
ncbi:phasin family protein [Stenotrophomonas sp. YIM B06876]|uniref:phasin family protein n=1 Tax=Stenotrophomonas sp. YIM B06876 TaxID=3060211 RepID=UPI002738DC70|nr:phasin family protein [Stenotrophomonas sp. YIM B06876]